MAGIPGFGFHLPSLPFVGRAAGAIGSISANRNVPAPPDVLGNNNIPDGIKKLAGTLSGQRFLKGLGYNIDTDGDWGQISKAAWKNMLTARDKDISPQAAAAFWSANSPLSNSYTSPIHPAQAATTLYGNPAPTPKGASRTSGTKSGSTVSMKATPSGAVKIKPLDLSAQLKQLMANMVNPEDYVNMVTEADNPGIQALQDEITRRETAGTGQIDENLRKWYESMIGQNNAGAAATAAAGQRLSDSMGANTAGLVNVLGGSASPAASSAAQQGQINAGELASNIGALGSYDASQGANLALKGVEDRLAAQQDSTSALDDLRLKLIDMQNTSGQNKAQAWLDALNLRGQQINDIADMKGIMQMAAADALGKGQALTAGSIANKNAALSYDTNALKLALGMKNMAQGGVTPWDQLDPSKLQALKKELLGGAVNDKNVLLYDPIQTLNAWGRALRGLSHGQWNPYSNAEIDQWRDDLLRSMIPGWNAAHPKKKYAFNKNGKLVRI